MRTIARILGLVFLLALPALSACGGSDGPSEPELEPVAAVEVAPSDGVTLFAGEDEQFQATPLNTAGEPIALGGRTAQWSSTNTSVATVSSSGLVTGVDEGTTIIRATIEGVFGSADVAVQVPRATLQGIVTDPFGGGVPGAQVQAIRNGSSQGTTTTGPDGRFSFVDVPTGEYTIEVARSGFNAAQFTATLTTGGADVQISLEPESLPATGALGTRSLNFNGPDWTFEVDVFVVDSDAKPVTSLNPADFDIDAFPVGSAGTLSFTQDEVTLVGTTDLGPYSAALLLDQSGSITSTDPNDSRIQASKLFLDALGGGENAALAAFTSGSQLPNRPFHVYGGFTSNGASFFSTLDQLANLEDGGTPLFDSTIGLLDFTAANAPNSNRALIVFTDGEDTSSSSDVGDVINHSRIRGVPVFTVGLGNGVDFTTLGLMASETGGTFMWAADARQLVSLYGTLGGVLRGSVSFYRTRWTANLSNGTWGPGAGITTSVDISTSAGTLAAPFVARIPSGSAAGSLSASSADPVRCASTVEIIEAMGSSRGAGCVYLGGGPN